MPINAGRDLAECCYPPWKYATSTAVVDEDVFQHYEHINNNFQTSSSGCTISPANSGN